jgi:hypothetical protein
MKPVEFDLGALFRLVVIGEIRIARDPRIDLADLALRQHLPSSPTKRSSAPGEILPTGAGLLQRVLGIGKGDRTRFGAAGKIRRSPAPTTRSSRA